MKKPARGQTNTIVIILLILIVLTTIVIVWNIVMPLIKFFRN